MHTSYLRISFNVLSGISKYTCMHLASKFDKWFCLTLTLLVVGGSIEAKLLKVNIRLMFTMTNFFMQQ